MKLTKTKCNDRNGPQSGKVKSLKRAHFREKCSERLKGYISPSGAITNADTLHFEEMKIRSNKFCWPKLVRNRPRSEALPTNLTKLTPRSVHMQNCTSVTTSIFLCLTANHNIKRSSRLMKMHWLTWSVKALFGSYVVVIVLWIYWLIPKYL